jgi:TRAP-type C4-dicarboxylate transport system substrate-binding protein
MNMLMRKSFILVIVMLVVLSVAGMKDSEAASPEKIVLKFGTPQPPEQVKSLATKAWMEKIEKETNGRVKFESYFSGTLIGPQAVMDLKKGVVNIANIQPMYEKAGFRLSQFVLKSFQVCDRPEIYPKVYKEIWNKFPELRKEYDGMKVLALSAGVAHRLSGVVPVKSLADLKGLKIRPSPEAAQLAMELGADVVNVPMTEVYESLQKKIIKVLIAPQETYKTYRFAEFIKYEVPNFSISRGCQPQMAMNIETWNKLPPDIQKVFDANQDFWFLDQYNRELDRAKEGAKLADQYGVERNPFPQSEIDRLNEIYKKVILKEAADLDTQGLPASKIYNEIEVLLKKYCSEK